MADWLQGRVSERVDWNDHLFSLRIKCADFPCFKPGQFTKVGIKQGNKVVSRAYSLVNAPGDDCLEIIVVPVPEGTLSPQLHLLRPKDEVQVMAPATGFLTLEEVPQSNNLWMMATGTGVGPFLSILSDPRVWHDYAQITLLYGMRHAVDFAYRSQLEHWQQRHPQQFHLIPVVSRERVQGCAYGRIPGLLASAEFQQYTPQILSAEDSQVMLCGNPEMIKETAELLMTMGLNKHLRRSPGQISMERYW